ncbi:MAG TPA: FeoB-associated Cys-rich membrane protein [Ohtaekwangia sp.]|uniref:FeoB-associated Cys-rich membrane protein n=1 Tax=Ohtaekwangia sp. TaxID=2066019 RepID=UPI002F928AF4
MIQNVIVALVFALALVYIGRMLYRNFKAKSACESGCGKCGATSSLDFAKIEKQLKEKGL